MNDIGWIMALLFCYAWSANIVGELLHQLMRPALLVRDPMRIGLGILLLIIITGIHLYFFAWLISQVVR